MLLAAIGYQVEVAFDGLGAVDLFNRQRPQIVLCDIGLPGLNGYEVATRIREAGSNDQPKPVLIAITGYASAADRVKALASGFDHHLAKRVDFEELLDLIHHASMLATAASNPEISRSVDY